MVRMLTLMPNSAKRFQRNFPKYIQQTRLMLDNQNVPAEITGLPLAQALRAYNKKISVAKIVITK